MSRSAFATPSRCISATCPRSSSAAVRIDWCSPMVTPNGFSISRTRCSMAMASGPISATAKATGRAVSSAALSGLEMARVFGSTSANTMTSTDMPTVA